MSEELWNALQAQLAQPPTVTLLVLCVGCWYKAHAVPFPAAASSSLCYNCQQQMRQTRSVWAVLLGSERGRRGGYEQVG